ncbi:MAG: glycosyl transferase family protein [Allosphingosinicella sp.]|uniref:glycosyl transferase family protein n=1 Tax=Allosphingosinicella sp. TaxID=2823234 RepID=UPI0039492ED8
MLAGLALEQHEWLWDYFDILGVAAFFLSILILISAADDLFLDAWYWTRRLYRRATGKPLHIDIPVERLRAKPERPLAIMVPAWQEHDVIASMISNLVSTIDYRRYVVFAGTYPNDEKTIAEVERMRRRYRHLVRVEVPNPGPTCKADCLNAIVRAIFAWEQKEGERFAGAILHDSEDVLHPLEFRFFNWMLESHDLIQIPVVALERRWYDLVSGTYMDEFSEWHSKDLVVRESMTGTVPSAGVGTCFSRRALSHLVRDRDGEPFNTDTLTEDYDIAERLARVNMRSTIAHYPVPYRVARRGFGRKPRAVDIQMPLCVREYFPDGFRASYRQKARWTLGISLQGWQQLGWARGAAANYFLFRDRKVLVTSFIGVAVYFLIFNILLLFGAMATGAWRGPAPDVFSPSGLFGLIVSLNVAAFFLRLAQRAWFVSRLHGWENGVLAVPRLIVGTIVNAAATMRALRQFSASVFLGRKLVWDKTMHDFPTGSELVASPQRLGEILVAWRAVTAGDLEEARAEQRHNPVRIGQLLLRRGLVDEDTLTEAIAWQAGLERGAWGPDKLRAHEHLLPRALALRLGALPVGLEDGRLVVAVANRLDDAALNEIAAATGAEPVQVIVSDRERETGLALLREAGPVAVPAKTPALADLLIEAGGIAPERLHKALQIYQPALHGRVGDFLITLGVAPPEVIERALREQQRIATAAGQQA